MSDSLDASLAEDVGQQLNPQLNQPAPQSADSSLPPDNGSRYEFGEDFQLKVVALMLLSDDFCRRTEGLVNPEYFQREDLRFLATCANDYFSAYHQCGDRKIITEYVRKQVAKSRFLRDESLRQIASTLRECFYCDMSGVEFAAEEVAEFADVQEFSRSMLESYGALEKGDVLKAREIMRSSREVGVSDMIGVIDYWEDAENRAKKRQEALAGTIRPKGITTGNVRLDQRMMHRGYGRGELTLYMGPPKVGKSMALMGAAKHASLKGFNALIVSLEVSDEIAALRIDADISDLKVDDVLQKPNTSLRNLQSALKSSPGKLMIVEFPSGEFTPSRFRRLINEFKGKGIIFDLVALDYLDLMTPDVRTYNDISESKEIYRTMRGIAQREDFALVSATQTNREGAKVHSSDMTHVAEDFNRIRIADLVIAINADEEEVQRGEARLRFIASRNQKGGFSIRIEQDREKMRFVSKVLQEEP